MIALIISFIQVAALCCINFVFVDLKSTTLHKAVVSVFLGIIAMSSFYFIDTLGIVIPLVILLGYNYLLTKAVIKSLSSPVFALLILVLSDQVSSLVGFYIFDFSIDQIGTAPIPSLFHVVVFSAAAVSFTFVSLHFFKKIKAKVVLERRHMAFLSGLLLLTIIFVYVTILISGENGFSRDIVLLNSFVFLAYFILFIGIGLLLLSTVVKEWKWKNKQEEYRQLRNHSENLEEMYGELRKFKHDYINILSSLSEFIRKEDMEGLKGFFHDKVLPTGKDMEKHEYKLGDLKHIKMLEIKGVLVSKLVKAQEAGVDVNLEAVEPIEDMPMDAILLSRCLGILLDNAVEETEKQEQGRMHIAFVRKESSTLIAVVNTLKGEVPKLFQVYQDGFSTKGSNRGIGLTNLKEITSKLENVTLETKMEGRLFFQQLEIFEEGGSI